MSEYQFEVFQYETLNPKKMSHTPYLKSHFLMKRYKLWGGNRNTIWQKNSLIKSLSEYNTIILIISTL